MASNDNKLLAVDNSGDVVYVSIGDVRHQKPLLVAHDENKEIVLFKTNAVANTANTRCKYYHNNNNFFITQHSELTKRCNGWSSTGKASSQWPFGNEPAKYVTPDKFQNLSVLRVTDDDQIEELKLHDFINAMNSTCESERDTSAVSRAKLIGLEKKCHQKEIDLVHEFGYRRKHCPRQPHRHMAGLARPSPGSLALCANHAYNKGWEHWNYDGQCRRLHWCHNGGSWSW